VIISSVMRVFGRAWRIVATARLRSTIPSPNVTSESRKPSALGSTAISLKWVDIA